MKKLKFLGTVALVLGFSGTAFADYLYIDEIGEQITYKVLDQNGLDVTASRVSQVVSDKPEYLEFRLLINNAGSGEKAYTDLFEPLSGDLSDRFWVYFDPAAQQNGGLLVKFWSDGANPALFPNDTTYHYPLDATETGENQLVGQAFNTNIGDSTYQFYAKSDVPEPSSGILIGAGLCGLALLRKKSRK